MRILPIRCCSTVLYGVSGRQRTATNDQRHDHLVSDHGVDLGSLVGVAGFEPAASSSRSQVSVRSGSRILLLTLCALSTTVRRCVTLAVGIVTQLVTPAAHTDTLLAIAVSTGSGSSDLVFSMLMVDRGGPPPASGNGTLMAWVGSGPCPRCCGWILDPLGISRSLNSIVRLPGRRIPAPGEFRLCAVLMVADVSRGRGSRRRRWLP